MGRMETAELSEELPDRFRTWRPPFTFPPALCEGSSFSTSSPTPVIVLKKKKKVGMHTTSLLQGRNWSLREAELPKATQPASGGAWIQLWNFWFLKNLLIEVEHTHTHTHPEKCPCRVLPDAF